MNYSKILSKLEVVEGYTTIHGSLIILKYGCLRVNLELIFDQLFITPMIGSNVVKIDEDEIKWVLREHIKKIYEMNIDNITQEKESLSCVVGLAIT